MTDYERVGTVSMNASFGEIINDFKDLTMPVTSNQMNQKRSTVQHQIITNGQPVFARASRLNPEKLAIVKREFNFMIKSGVC